MNRRQTLVAIAALGTAAAAPRTASALDVVRVTSNPADAALEANYGQLLGFATESGLDCNIQLLSSGVASVSAVVGGACDVGFSNLLSVLTAREKGLPLAIIAAGALYTSKNPISLVLVPSDSAAKSGRDLDGKTFAVPGLGDLNQIAAMAWIDRSGGNARAVRFLEIPFSAMPVALAEHRVDAAFVTEPFASRAKEHARVLASAFDAIADRFLISCYFTTAAWASAHPDLARRFAAMIYHTGTFANTNHARTGEFLMQIAHIDADQLRQTPRATFAERVEAATVTPVIDAAVRYGALKNAIAPLAAFAPEVLG